ncbi:site-specific DNA-methyltransferase [Ruegeria sediminis]|uniref:Methyltransferase n=1 Tax=Ruegeria sediminis TaxID=2583820 RepID=A0ABY2WVC7_9RHOB|nr:DNA methyltransferase [Ruegeria sediminis]TMV06566.1 site-specific DNA-methyltransferase [Ruegeria sediminis]
MPANLETIATKNLVPSPRNARTHDRKQLDQIAASIRQFGFTNPVLIDEDNVVIAGHGRLQAAKQIGLDEVPAIRVTHLSAPEKRTLMLADNKIADNAGWDLDLLAIELADLSEMELNFDIDVTGFETAEIDLIIGGSEPDGESDAEIAPVPDRDQPLITQRGDLWFLGQHRVLCGDARKPSDYAALMDDEVADMGFTDPPYNVPISGHVCGNGRVQHREFAEAAGEMSPQEFTCFLGEALGLGAKHSRDGAVWYACIDWRHLPEMHVAGLQAFDAWLNLCVWAKTNAGLGSLYRSQHELICVFRKGQGQHQNNVQLGKYGRNRTNLWSYPGVNTFRAGRMEELQAHPTPKPVAMIKDAILDVTKRGDIVLDPFLGSGSTLIAAERCGRVTRGLEIDPAYVDVALRRWRDETGKEPVRANDRRTLASLERELTQEAGQ